MIVVKLGGSLFSNPLLTTWLEQLTQQAQQHTIIIVPGGGPFADTVRQADIAHDLDATTTHHMAILAMRQFGLLLLDLCPSAQSYTYPSNTATSLPPLSIWLPDQQLLSAPTLPHSWDVTSDTLALWLAQQHHADSLTLLKHNVTHPFSLAELSQHNIIDQAFEAQLQQAPIPFTIVDANTVQTIHRHPASHTP